MKALTNKQAKIIISVLAGLLAASILALGVVIVVKNGGLQKGWAVIRDNFIKGGEETVDESYNPASRVVLPLSASIGAPGLSLSAPVPSATADPMVTLALYNLHPDENIRFNEDNIFPGDVYERDFRVMVYHHATVTLRFHADVREGYEFLGDVLYIRIDLPELEGVLYDGPFNDMPAEVRHVMTESEDLYEDVHYHITVYIDTSVGNEYQEKDLIADFRWWVEEDLEPIIPPTGGRNLAIYIGVGLIVLAAAALIIIPIVRKRRKNNEDQPKKGRKADPTGISVTQRKITGSIVVIFILAFCLAITTSALVYATVSVENNLFRTGRVKINLNNGEPIIRENEFLFEPGMTVVKEFFIENLSTWDVYYKIYFGNIEGPLADVLEIQIKDGDTVIYEGTMTELTEHNVYSAPDPLAVMEKKYLQVWFHFPETAGNATQGTALEFDMFADAVQTKNNPDRKFD